MDQVIIGVDLGGTQMRAARFDPTLELLDRWAEPTRAQEGPDRVIPRLLDLIERVMPDDRSRVMGIGVSAHGHYRRAAQPARLAQHPAAPDRGRSV
jgi:glucokinase